MMLNRSQKWYVVLAVAIGASALIAIFAFARFKNEAQNSYTYKLPVQDGQIDIEKMMVTLSERLKGNSSNYADLNTLAELAFVQGRRTGNLDFFETAVATANQSLKILPSSNSQAKMVLAHVLETQHQFEEAIRLAQEILKESPNALGPYAILVYSNLAVGNLPAAQKYANILVQRSPKAGSLSMRGLVLISAGREVEGVFDLERSFVVEDLGENADSTWSRCILARYFLSRGEVHKARTLLNEALRISPQFPLALDLRAQLEARVGETRAAEQDFDLAFTRSRQVAYLRHGAELAKQLGKDQLALDRWSQAEILIRADLKKGTFGHRLDLAKVLLQRRQTIDLDEALHLIEKELEVRQSAETYFALAQILGFKNDWKNALNAILSALTTGAREPKFYDLCSVIYQNLGQNARANLYRELVRKQDPGFLPNLTFD